jgi:hypothetical protein
VDTVKTIPSFSVESSVIVPSPFLYLIFDIQFLPLNLKCKYHFCYQVGQQKVRDRSEFTRSNSPLSVGVSGSLPESDPINFLRVSSPSSCVSALPR